MSALSENPLVSIIVPIYKVETYLRRCVDSIIAQSYKNLDIILVDDGSPDACPQICDECARIDSRVKVVHKENGGLADARNAGLNVAAGDYIAFVDSDDLIHYSYIELLLKAIVSNQSDIAVTRFYKFSTESVSMDPVAAVPNKRILLSDAIFSYCSLNSDQSATFISCCNKLYKRKLFDSLRFPKGKLNEDAFVSYQVLASAKDGIILVDFPLYYYYLRNDSIVGASFSERNLDVLDAYHGAIRWFAERDESLSYNFYPPLLMREIYCWWGCKYVLKDKAKALLIISEYEKDCKQLKYLQDFSFKWKMIFKLFAYIPEIYAFYRKVSPFYLGNR